MTKKSPSNEPSAIRLKPEDKAAVKFIQEELSQPGLELNFTDAVRRSIHALANDLRSKSIERQKNEKSAREA